MPPLPVVSGADMVRALTRARQAGLTVDQLLALLA